MLPQGCVRLCPACGHRELGMDASLYRKLEFLKSRLSVYAGRIEPVISVEAPERFGYRDKVSLAARYTGFAWEFGVLRHDEMIAIPLCPVHTSRIRTVIALLEKALPPVTDFPLVRLVISGRQLTFILKTREVNALTAIGPTLFTELNNAGIEGVWVHLFPSSGRKVFGKGGWHLVWGKEYSSDENGLRYGPAAFQQLLPSLASRALDEAEAFLDPKPGMLVIDLYCGTGSSLKRWAALKALSAGVEQSGAAVAMARQNVPGAIIWQGACSQRIPQIREWTGRFDPDEIRLLYANPPGTGLESEITEFIVSILRPKRIAYLSCNAVTLSRDLKLLADGCYTLKRLIPFDFFPQTRHVECLALLQLDEESGRL